MSVCRALSVNFSLVPSRHSFSVNIPNFITSMLIGRSPCSKPVAFPRGKKPRHKPSFWINSKGLLPLQHYRRFLTLILSVIV